MGCSAVRFVVLVLAVSACTTPGRVASPAPLPSSTERAPPPPPPSPSASPSAVDRSIHVALGVPRDGDDSDDLLLDRSVYVVSYNPRRNVANWVAWNLDDRHLGHEDRQDKFRPDDGLPDGVHRVTAHDYAKSGYDRGHLCPSADRTRTPEENALTFLMTNMHPQVPELNRGDWKKLEEHERALAKKSKELFIVAGGIFGPHPATVGHGVMVPRAEYKIIVVLERGQGVESVTETTPVIAVVMPNDASVKDRPWSDYVVSVDDIERDTGYDFLPRVPERVQAVLEARRGVGP